MLGRPATIGRLSLDLAADPLLIASDVSIGEPPGFSTAGPAGTVARVEARLDRDALLHGQIHVLTLALDRPRLTVAHNGGMWNWAFPDRNTGPTIDHVAITDGRIHVIDPTRKTDIVVTLSDGKPLVGGATPIIADATGTDSALPVAAHLVGGSLDALRDRGKPYPIALSLRVGATDATLKGSVVDPLHLASARSAIDLRGDDLAALRSLVPISPASSRPYHLTATIVYADRVLRVESLAGTIGTSDVAGTVTLDLHGERPRATANLASHSAALSDLVRFLGVTSLKSGGGRVISDTPIGRSGRSAVDATVAYRAARITTESQTLQNGIARFTIDRGRLDVTALSAEAQGGTMAATMTLNDAAPAPHVVANLDFHAIDLKRLAAKDSLLQYTGRFTGQAHLDATGGSLAQMLGHGTGMISFTMSQGDMTSFLDHLPGIELGDPVIAALHLKTPTPIRCMAADFDLANGALESRVLVIDTSAGTFLGRGSIDMRDERIDYRIAPAPSRLPFGSLQEPIDIKGRLRHPVVTAAPDAPAPNGLASALGTVVGPIEAAIGTVQNSLMTAENCATALGRTK